MDDQKKKAVLASILGTLALGAGGYFVFGGNGHSTADSVAAQATTRAQRVKLADTEPPKRHEVRTLATTPKETKAGRQHRRTGKKAGKLVRIQRGGTRRPEKKRSTNRDPSA